jgi:hypothetical protein
VRDKEYRDLQGPLGRHPAPKMGFIASAKFRQLVQIGTLQEGGKVRTGKW